MLIQLPKKEELTQKGFTNRIRIAKGQTKESLASYGFTNQDPKTLYFCCMVHADISFNLTVDAETLQITAIDVLDEDFLQPYDYQSMILGGSQNKQAVEVFHNVNKVLQQLQNDGIIVGFVAGMYV